MKFFQWFFVMSSNNTMSFITLINAINECYEGHRVITTHNKEPLKEFHLTWNQFLDDTVTYVRGYSIARLTIKELCVDFINEMIREKEYDNEILLWRKKPEIEAYGDGYKISCRINIYKTTE